MSYKQQKAFNFIKGYLQSNHEAPTIKEIGEFVGYRSTASVFDALCALESMGLIIRIPNISRGIRLP